MNTNTLTARERERSQICTGSSELWTASCAHGHKHSGFLWRRAAAQARSTCAPRVQRLRTSRSVKWCCRRGQTVNQQHSPSKRTIKTMIMVKKHLFQYGDNHFHILQLKTKCQLHNRWEEHSEPDNRVRNGQQWHLNLTEVRCQGACYAAVPFCRYEGNA